MDSTGLTVLDVSTQPTELLVTWSYYQIISSKTRLFFTYIRGEVCSDVVVSLLSGSINLQCISECLPSIFLYSLAFIFMTGLVTFSLVQSYLVHEHTVSGYILTGDFIRHFESKELWEKSSCYVIHCIRSSFQFVGKIGRAHV